MQQKLLTAIKAILPTHYQYQESEPGRWAGGTAGISQDPQTLQWSDKNLLSLPDEIIPTMYQPGGY
jgi:hypothetical protein